jgi:hypothetical protein
LAFLKPIAAGWASGPDGERLYSMVPGANSRRAAGLATYALAGNPAMSMRWRIVRESGKK